MRAPRGQIRLELRDQALGVEGGDEHASARPKRRVRSPAVPHGRAPGCRIAPLAGHRRRQCRSRRDRTSRRRPRPHRPGRRSRPGHRRRAPPAVPGPASPLADGSAPYRGCFPRSHCRRSRSAAPCPADTTPVAARRKRGPSRPRAGPAPAGQTSRQRLGRARAGFSSNTDPTASRTPPDRCRQLANTSATYRVDSTAISAPAITSLG